MAFRLARSLLPYFSNEQELSKANLPVKLLFDRFPESEVRLKTSKATVFLNRTCLEEFTPEPIVEELKVKTHAEQVMEYFAKKEEEADEIFQLAAKELAKVGKQDLIAKLRAAVTFCECGEWIEGEKE